MSAVAEADASLRLRVPAEADSVAVARQAVAGLAEASGMREETVADLKTAVSEACMNAIVHGYADGEGPVEVSAQADSEALEVVVRDWGGGIQPRPIDTGRQSLRLGLSLIASMADRFEIRGGEGRGTTVCFAFERVAAEAGASERAEVPEGAVVEVDAGAHARGVLARVVSLLAARSGLSIERTNDAILLTDALAGDHGRPDQRQLRIELRPAAGGIEMRVGPLADGEASRLQGRLELPGLGGSLSSLADTVELRGEGPDAKELLVLHVAPAG